MLMQIELDNKIKSVCPIHGISFGQITGNIEADKPTWKIHFQSGATAEQIAMAQKVLDDFFWNEDIEKQHKKNEKVERYKGNMQIRSNYDLYCRTVKKISFAEYIDYLESIQL